MLVLPQAPSPITTSLRRNRPEEAVFGEVMLLDDLGLIEPSPWPDD